MGDPRRKKFISDIEQSPHVRLEQMSEDDCADNRQDDADVPHGLSALPDTVADDQADQTDDDVAYAEL